MTKLHVQPLRQPDPRRRRRKLASKCQLAEIRELALRARIEPPRVVWYGDAQAVIRRLRDHLACRNQPSLLEEPIR